MGQPRFKNGQVVKSRDNGKTHNNATSPHVVRGRISAIGEDADGYKYLVAGVWYKQNELVGLIPMVERAKHLENQNKTKNSQ